MSIIICNYCKNFRGLKIASKDKSCQTFPTMNTKNKTECNFFREYQAFTIIIDSREQQPWFYDKLNNDNFPGLKYINSGLTCGDYSLVSFSNPEENKHTICVERKSLSDLYGTLGNGRERFEKELIRMEKFTYKCIIIEADLHAIIKNPPEYSRMLPKSVFRSLIAISQRYNVQIWPCTNRSQAEKIGFLVLERFYRDYVGTFSEKTGNFKPGRHFVFDE